MTRIATIIRAREVIAKELGRTVEECANDTTLESLGADSLDVIELVMGLEQKFDLNIWDEDMEKMSTVGDYVYYVASAVDRRNETGTTSAGRGEDVSSEASER